MKNYISIGKITNFFGIKGEAKVGFDNENQIKKAKKVFIGENKEKEFNITSLRFHKNFAIIKFKEINDINELMEYKGEKIYILKDDAIKKLDKDEYLVDDLVGCEVFLQDNTKVGIVESVSASRGQDLLNIKNGFGQISAVPFVGAFFPTVDIKNKKIIIKPIEGLLS